MGKKFILVRADDGTKAVHLKSEAFNSFLHVEDERGTLIISDSNRSKFSINFQPEGAVVFECLEYKSPLYLSMKSPDEVTCQPLPITESSCFIIVVDT